jgi:hypothetical protein
MKFIAKINDTHANLWTSIAARPPIGSCQLPVDVRIVEGRPLVLRQTSATAGPASGLLPGDLIEQLDGVTGIGTVQAPLELPANGHRSHFVDELIAGLPAGFTGVLDLISTTPFAALTLRSLSNERNDFLVTAFPVADMTRVAPAPVVFPQIADGTGVSTQFILIGTGGASVITLSFHAEDGRPLVIGSGIQK